MRYARPFVILIALLLGACGAPQQAAQPTSAPPSTIPTIPATSAPATAIPTPEPEPSATTQPSSAPAPSAVPSPAASATAPLILEPTVVPTAPPATSTPVPPTAQPAPARAAGGAPVRLMIKEIGLDYKLVSVGLDKNRVPIVPDHDVGWYNLSAEPAQGENIVLWGHVLRFRKAPKIPAPFARLKELKPGARVVLYDKAGNVHAYTVTQQIWVTPDQVEYILPRGKEIVTMVSCIGDKIISNGEVIDESHRLITVAEPEA